MIDEIGVPISIVPKRPISAVLSVVANRYESRSVGLVGERTQRTGVGCSGAGVGGVTPAGSDVSDTGDVTFNSLSKFPPHPSCEIE